MEQEKMTKTITDKNGKTKTIVLETPTEESMAQPTVEQGQQETPAESSQPLELTQLNDSVPTEVGPKEGDTVIAPNGDTEVFENGTWVVHVSHSPMTGE